MHIEKTKKGSLEISEILHKAKNHYYKIIETEKGRYLISIGIVLSFFMILYLSTHIVFFINDDTNILYTLSGNYTNSPADHPFVNFALGGVIRFLYTIIPFLPWYGIFHVSMIFGSMVLMTKSILKECARRKIKMWICLTIIVALFVSLFIYPVVLMQFTTTSALAGTASTILLLSISKKDSKKSMTFDFSLSVVMMLLCYMHRKNSAYVLLCFYFFTMFYKIIKELILENNQIRQYARKLIITSGSLIVLIITVIGVSSLARSSQAWDDYREYDTARFQMMDYPHDRKEDNPELYQKINWSDGLYSLTGQTWSWFLMDERINAGTFSEIAATGYNSESRSVSEAIDTAENLWENETYAKISILIITCFAIIYTVMFANSKLKHKNVINYKNIIDFVFIYGTMGAFSLATIYLCWKQRLPLRAFQVIIFPTVLILIIMFIRKFNFKLLKGNLEKGIMSVMLVAIISVSFLIYPQVRNLSNSRYEKSQHMLTVEEYAMNNYGNIYIYDTSLTFRYLPFVNYPNDKPFNVMFWGGVGWHAPYFHEQIAENNLRELYSDVLFEDNVYYVTRNTWTTDGKGTTVISIFDQYMKETYGEVIFNEVEDLGDGIMVYKVSKIAEE